MATIFIERLCVETVIGINDWERQVPQSLYLDIEAEANTDAAAGSDNIADALDYAAMAAATTQFVQASERILLESLLADLGRHLLMAFGAVQSLAITVRKPLAIDNADCAGIRMHFRR